MARKRNRKKRKGRTNIIRLNKEEKDFYSQCISEAFINKIKIEKDRESAESSEIVKSCLERRERQKVLIMKNLPFSITKNELDIWLKGILVRCSHRAEIIHIKLLRHRKGNNAGRKSGKAQIIVSDANVLEFLLNEATTSYGIQIGGRRIGMQEFTGSLPKYVKDKASIQEFNMIEVAIGYLTFERDFQSKWDNQNVTLEMNGRESRQISMKIGNYRLEFQLSDIMRLYVTQDQKNKRVILFKFRHPPLVFKRIKEFSEIWNLFFNLNLDEDEDNMRMERTVDWTVNGFIGSCVYYRLVGPTVRSPEDRKLLATLRQYNLRSTELCSVSLLDSRTQQITLDNRKNMNWCSVHSDHFRTLPFSTRYLLHVLLSAHKLWFEDVNQLNQLEAALSSLSTSQADQILIDWFYTDDEYSLNEWVNWILQQKDLETQGPSELLTRKVYITPTRICPLPPQPDVTNRIIRQYHELRDRFLRVSFSDENFASILQARSEDIFEHRIRPLLKEGIVVGGHLFKFLAFSNSQLREQSCWMYDESRHDNQPIPPTADEIRASMGNLTSIKIIGKYASRMGQGFSSSDHSLQLSNQMVSEIPDVIRNNYTFSDGVGRISCDLADQVRQLLGISTTPSAFQIRYKGAKGVLSVMPKLRQKMVELRPSMIKFEGHEEHCDLEIISYSKPIKCFLNRQAITVLSSLGINDTVFMFMLRRMLKRLDSCLIDEQSALDVLDGAADRMVCNMIHSRIGLQKDPFLMKYLVAVRNCLIVGLQTKARILVQQGINLIGIMDEYNVIPPNKVFFQWTEGKEIKRLPPNTRVAIYRAPCLHPGDIQVLTTFDHSELHHLVDVVVFSSQGRRPTPNELSGGDLDGDIYSVIHDPSLVPAENFPAMEYHAPPVPSNTVHRVTIDHVIDFFVDYVKNDNLGIIANAHVVFADQLPEGARSLQCLKLAELHSIAVDFAKTGIPASIPSSLRVESYPDFMEKSLYSTSYKSQKVLGQIYRYSKKYIKILEEISSNVEIDSDLIIPGWEEYLEDAEETFESYSKELWEIMCRFDVYDEGQLLSKHVMKLTRKNSASKQQGKNEKQHLDKHISDMVKSFREEFWEEFESSDLTLEVMKKASSWYQVTYRNDSPIYSFPWITAWEVLCHIKQIQSNDNVRVDA